MTVFHRVPVGVIHVAHIVGVITDAIPESALPRSPRLMRRGERRSPHWTAREKAAWIKPPMRRVIGIPLGHEQTGAAPLGQSRREEPGSPGSAGATLSVKGLAPCQCALLDRSVRASWRAERTTIQA
nr:hypothetical protein [Nitrosomonas nitrosa]